MKSFKLKKTKNNKKTKQLSVSATWGRQHAKMPSAALKWHTGKGRVYLGKRRTDEKTHENWIPVVQKVCWNSPTATLVSNERERQRKTTAGQQLVGQTPPVMAQVSRDLQLVPVATSWQAKTHGRRFKTKDLSTYDLSVRLHQNHKRINNYTYFVSCPDSRCSS